MVLTVRPPGKGSGDDFEDAQAADRLAVRRAAVGLMSERGFAGVTVDDIVGRVGISRRTFFRLFAGKHQVVSCDHGVFHAEVRGFLSRHDGERTLARAAQAAGLVLDSLTAVRDDAELRERIIDSDASLRTEESRWFSLHQGALAEFLTEPQGPTTSLEAEMLAASLVAAVRVSLRDWLADPAVSPAMRLREGVALLRTDRSALPTRRTVALIETPLDIDELIERLGS